MSPTEYSTRKENKSTGLEQNKRQWTEALPFSAPWLRLRDRFCSPQFNTVYKDVQKRNSETGKTIKVVLQWQKDLHATPHRRKPKLCSIYYWQHRLSPYLQIFLGCRPLSWQMAGCLPKANTGARLTRWCMMDTETCLMSSNARETRQHLFFECTYSK